jgi:electron transport complex protein RnfE
MMLKDFTKGLFKENPTFIIMLGLCPTLAVSTQFINALGMGAAVIFVLLGSNIVVSLLKNFIPDKVRIPAYIIVIAAFVTIINLLMQAFTPVLAENLGVFLPLVVVNCIIIGRAEAFASKNGVTASVLDALGMGIGFTLALCLIALVRESIGSGTLTLVPLPIPGLEDGVLEIPGLVNAPAAVLVAPAGALLVIGLLKGLFNASGSIKKRVLTDLHAFAKLIVRRSRDKAEKEKRA